MNDARRYVVLDTETTGLSTLEGHKIIEIGCVEIIDGNITERTFHHYLNPGRAVSDGSFAVHGLSNEFLADKLLFKDIAQDLLDFTKDATLIIHNAKFDMDFINYELSFLELPKLSNRVIDTVRIAKQKYPGLPASLDSLCERFRIDISGRTKHGALLDSTLLANVFLYMLQDGGITDVIQEFLNTIKIQKFSQPITVKKFQA